MRGNLHVRWLLYLLCGVLLSLSFLTVSPKQASAVTPQIDTAPYTPSVTFTESGGKRHYTIKNLLINDDPFILETGWGTESFESLYKRNTLAFEANLDKLLVAIEGQTTSTYKKHTGWFGFVEINGEILVNKYTENGYIGETYSVQEISEAYNRYKSTFPEELVNAIAAKSQSAKIFEVVHDSREKRDVKYHLYGGHRFTTTTNGINYSAGDDVFIQYKDNYVFVDVSVDVDIPATCPDGSPKPADGNCDGGGIIQTCPDGSPMPSSGNCGGSVQTCPDGSPMPSSGNCGGSVQTCPDGSPMPSSGNCGGSVQTCPDGSPMPSSGNCEPPPPPDTDPECHPSALGSYPNCYPDEIDLTEEFEREYFPTWGTGEISWGLSKVTKAVTGGSPTQIASTNLLPIGDGHYEALTPQYNQSGVLTGDKGKTTPRNVTESDLGTEIYAVNYDFTNWAIETYKCTAPAESTVTQTNIEGGVESSYDVTAYDYSTCYEPFSDTSSYWELIDERADWTKGETYACEQPLEVDHSYGTILKGKNSVSGTYNLGRHADVQAFANSCEITSDEVFTETISHDSEHKKLNTQTYIEFVENPVTWQGNPNYDTTTVMPYVADTSSQGDMGVPELDGVFKKNNKYTTPTADMLSPYNVPLRQEVTGTDMKVLSKDDFWVSRSTGFVYSVPAPSTAASATTEIASKFKDYTGQAYRDVILDRPQLTSMYYLPIDPNENVMKPNTEYSLEMFLRNIGYNNVTVQHEQTFEFKHYLLGSVFEETNPNVTVKIVEQNEIPYEDIQYPYSSTLTVAKAKDMYDETHGRENFIFGHKATDSMAVFDKGVGIIGIDFGQKVDNPLPHVIDRESANDTLYTEWD